MDRLVLLQETLRAIETGQRLESVDGVLVRQVLQQRRTQLQQSAPEPDTKDLYRELLALRKNKANAKKNAQRTDESGNSAATRSVQGVSPKKLTSVQRKNVDTRLESAPSSPERVHISNNNKTIAETLAANTEETIDLMQTALVFREKELHRSEKAVARADAELREELVRAEKILPSKFLFERNLASDRQLEAARNVLTRFQHRFFKLFFRRWWGITLTLRLQAQCRAVTTIIRVYRGHQGRREAQRLRRELSAMQAQKRQLLAFRIKYRSSQAVKLQMAWRRYLRLRAIKYRQARQAAAILLQRAFRTRQWRGQSLVNTLANARKLFAAVSFQKLYRGYRARRKLRESRQRQRQEERVQLALLRSMSKQARAVWMIERRGAGYLIAQRAVFPYAMRMRWHRLLGQLRRQRAAKCIAKAVCKWFGVEARREAVRGKQVNEWMELVQREHERSRCAAVLIQKHLRRWVQQRKFLMAQARRKKVARRTRLAEKTRRMEQVQQHKSPLEAGNSPVRIISSSSAQPTRIKALLKPIQLKEGDSKATQKTDAKAAIAIQCCYRRYRMRKRVRFRMWRNETHKVEARVLQRRKAATEIQRRVRGIHGRKLARQRRAERLLLRFILHWRWRRIQERQRAARRIGRWFKNKRTKRLAKLWRVEKQKRLAASARMQQWYRVHCLLPSRLRRVLQSVRRRDETLGFCDQSLRLCRQHKADELVAQSLSFSLEDALRPLLSETTRSPTRSKTSPTKQKAVASNSGKRHSNVVAFPVLQMMFLMASGWKMPFVWRELDGKTLFQTKLERTKAVTFFRSLTKQGNPVAHQIQQSPAVETGTSLSPTRRNKKPVTKGAKGVETFSSVDVDVAVARATGGAKGALDFASFVRVIGLLGEISLTQQSQSPYWGRFDGTEARVLALSWSSLLPHSSMQPLALQFETFVSTELSRHASCLQRLFARQHFKLRGKVIILEMRRNLRKQELSRAAVVLQTQARELLARRELRRRMQETYEKFLDPTWGLPYWMNPRSAYSTWQKPRILGAEDVQCEPVPFPLPERTLKAPCNGRKDCDRCAEWVCYDCDEFFCLQCFGEYHKVKIVANPVEDSKDDSVPKAESIETLNDSKEDDNTLSSIKREHELERLLLCGLCKFQLASRRCLDCIPKLKIKSKPKLPPSVNQQKEIKTVESASNEDQEHLSSESLFCDVCFGFLHRRGGLQTHRTEPLLELCTSCIPDDQDDKHTASHQQPPAVFGVRGAVQWDCEACGDPPRRVCGRCALQSHPKESCGQLRPVPLQTLGRQQRTKRLREEQEARDRADLDKMRARALRARRERCARKIQTFWRSQAPILRARRLVVARRKETSEQWLRRQEDARVAKRMAYRAKNALGMAPPLSSDTPVERRLRSLHALARRQLSIRARFFGLLIDEYVTVGIPLPGLGLLHPGSNEVWTSEDLRGWIRNRQTIRFKRLTTQQSQPAERALCAWRQLEQWGKEGVERDVPAEIQSEATDATWLAEVHPKQAITESVVPLVLTYDAPLPKQKRRKADEEEDVVEDIPVAMFLVEFSLDPRRTVWINHSLAERFWEWKRLKLLARSERVARRERAKDYEKQQKENEDKRKQVEELKRQDDAVNAANFREPTVGDEAIDSVDQASNVAASDYTWSQPAERWVANETPTDPYYNYNYYPSANPAEASAAWTGYDGYSTAYITGYGYDYGNGSTTLDTSPALDGGAAGLVDSGDYYANAGYAGDMGASNWYGTEYSTYNMSGYSPAPTDYTYNDSNNPNGWDSYSAYDSATGYTESQPSVDPSVAWYANGGDPNYNSTEQWQQNYYSQVQEQAQALDNYPNGESSSPYDVNGSSYSIELSSAADGYNYPYTSNVDSQTYSTPQSTTAAQWEEVFDPTTQQTYYVNRVTNETAWQIPS
ncbi:hypothetical protein PC129_g8008 [Phytophthora cactorum]|uniref:Probable pectate lyase F n=1 Tax=Phytophthora cactorum TaxID=29920 RepID=A0A329S1F3_9STRA|nr:hypothetical protein Pcac1_g6629 [Phytophthora cactorum]KAG2824783.1 hypothetical protein PC111_g9666 [Phytophthora cactorum]KAG2825797.1 hypothetical protein PC112_g9559 [Phytophthora cactorum]KAG2860867.1 hypothetical protein PC113_g7681 [Phytophthora cactorum]KAG2904464.1 hypothetical protein PC114_g11852 [Phytophthora cactorum]